MTDDGRCTGCGARTPLDDGTCSYCGTLAVAAPPAPSEPPDPAGARRARLERVRESAQFERLRRFVPSAIGPMSRLTMMAILGAVIVAAGIYFVTTAGRHGGLFVFIPLAMSAFGLYLAVSFGSKLARLRGAPTNAYAARVANKRTEVTRGQHGNSYSYYATLQYANGARVEYEVASSMYGLLSVDEVGVAHVRDAYLLAFRIVDE